MIPVTSTQTLSRTLSRAGNSPQGRGRTSPAPGDFYSGEIRSELRLTRSMRGEDLTPFLGAIPRGKGWLAVLGIKRDDKRITAERHVIVI